MRGRLANDQDKFFYDFHLEDHVPSDHLLRRIDAVLDLSWLGAEPSPFYSLMGRPSVDPEPMIRMPPIGYCFGLRSERRLCDEVPLNLAYRWFCRLGLEDRVPDHSTFSLNRHGLSVRPGSCARCSRTWYATAWGRALSAARASPLTRA